MLSKSLSAEYTAPGSVFLKQHLVAAGIGSNCPLFASIAAKHHFGQSSAEYQRYLTEQGNGENWTEFPRGFSPYQLQRILNGQSAQKSSCIAVGKAFTEVTGLTAPEFATDPLPLMGQLAAELEARVDLAKQRVINDLLEPPEFHYARSVPLKDKDIGLIAIQQTLATEAVIEVEFRTTRIQVGLILLNHNPKSPSIIYAPQAYRWTGSEVTVGRKKIRSIELNAQRVRSAVSSYLSTCSHPSITSIAS